MKKIGLSKQMPPSEARPLGTKRTSKVKPSLTERIVAAGRKSMGDRITEIIEKDGFCDVTLKVVDTPIEPVVDFSHQPTIPPATVSRSSRMTLTYVKTSKNGKRAIYSGAANSLVFPLTAFPGKTAPASIEVVGDVFATKSGPKPKLTKEERAALPKPTLAERIAKREAQLAKDKAKLAAASAM